MGLGDLQTPEKGESMQGTEGLQIQEVNPCAGKVLNKTEKGATEVTKTATKMEVKTAAKTMTNTKQVLGTRENDTNSGTGNTEQARGLCAL